MEAPKVMAEYPKKKTIRWVDDETGEECGSAEYILRDAPELVALVEALRDAVERGESPLADNGEVYMADKAKDALSSWEALNNE